MMTDLQLDERLDFDYRLELPPLAIVPIELPAPPPVRSLRC